MPMLRREILSREECTELLNGVPVGGIAITVDALLAVIP